MGLYRNVFVPDILHAGRRNNSLRFFCLARATAVALYKPYCIKKKNDSGQIL